MAVQSLERLLNLRLRSLTWANRTLDRINRHPLSQRVSTVDLKNLEEQVWNHEISIFATATDRYLLTHENLVGNKALRKNKHMKVILDMGLPRNVDPGIHGSSGFYVRDVDEFNTRAVDSEKKRQLALSAAEAVLVNNFKDFPLEWQRWSQGDERAQPPPSHGTLSR